MRYVLCGLVLAASLGGCSYLWLVRPVGDAEAETHVATVEAQGVEVRVERLGFVNAGPAAHTFLSLRNGSPHRVVVHPSQIRLVVNGDTLHPRYEPVPILVEPGSSARFGFAFETLPHTLRDGDRLYLVIRGVTTRGLPVELPAIEYGSEIYSPAGRVYPRRGR